jgi:hypothetical protein
VSHIPHKDRTVSVRRRDETRVSAEYNQMDPLMLTRKLPDLPTLFHIPDPDNPIINSTPGNSITIGSECNSVNHVLVGNVTLC